MALDALFLSRWVYSTTSTLRFFISFSIVYSLNFFSLHFFFGKKSLQDSLRFKFSSKFNKVSRIFSYYNFLINVDFIMSYLFGSFTLIFFNKQLNYFNLAFLKLINLSLNRFITYNYCNYSVTRNWPLSGLNFKFIRDFKSTVSSSLMGFKLLCLGRFSRRQRARKIFFSDFKMPLTKISANIDYNFSVVSIDNSAVSVKIWLYKNDRHPNFYLKSI